MEKKFIDLHTHSYYSDGTFSPEGLVILAKKQGLSALALTDHDTIDGLVTFHEAGKKQGVETISGIEFGTLYEKYIKTEIHIVGLCFNETAPTLLETMAFMHHARRERNLKMVDKLCSIGLAITMEELNQDAGGEIITRAHYANVLVKKGYVKTKYEAFHHYISPGCPGYVEREFLTPKQCIETIKNAGGVAILAHPTLYSMNYLQIETMCQTLQTYGLDGMEAEYSTFNHEQEREIKKIAKKLGLAPSGGSDFHGANKPDIQLGIGKGTLKIPYSYLEELKKLKK